MANASVAILVPWLVLAQTGSATDAGLVAAVASVPGIVLSPFVGALVDRLGRRRVSVGSDVLSAVSVIGFPVLAAQGELDLSTIIALTLLGAAFDPAGYTARKSLIPDAAEASEFGVARLNGIHEGIFSAGWVIGPALAAAGIATIGAVQTFWLTAVAFVLAALAVTALRVTEGREAARAAAGDEHEAFWASSLRGARELWADRPLRVLTVAIAVIVLVYMPTESVILPAYFQGIGEPRAYGLTMTMLAAGGMVGAFSYGWLSERLLLHRIAVGSLVACTVAMIPMALLPPLPIFVTAGFLLGLAWGPMNPLLNTLVQTRIPAHVQGRVYGVQTALFYAAPPVGLLLTGPAVDRWGVQPVYAVLGGMVALTTLLVAALPGLRDLDT